MDIKERLQAPQIKICGITLENEVDYLNEAKVNYAGFVFYEKSKRNISFEKAESIIMKLDPDIKKVAVTVSPDLEFINRINETGFDIIQIHGEPDERVIKASKKPVWMALNIKDITAALTYDRWRSEEEIITGIVLDAPNYGSGKTFDWSESSRIKEFTEKIKNRYSFILAGGLTPLNVREGIRIFAPDVVDVSSGVEGRQGKDKNKILEFVRAARELA